MPQLHESLSDLSEHGPPPFVGRSFETQLLGDFWKSTFHAERLRGLVISGEAGAGKSRLLEAFLPSVAEQGGVVAHIKLYHGGSAAIAPLAIEAVRATAIGHQVVRSDGGSSLSAAAQALRRIARLRPLLLVIEDIQLLEGEALQELSQLLEMLGDEPISALFVTRPVKHGARGVIERHLVDELTLSGLGIEDIAGMWLIIMGDPPPPGMAEQLHAATLGNPLALRSAMREAARHHERWGASPGAAGDGWIGGEAFRYSLEHRVELLAEGMVAHLNEREIHDATVFASLGEVFAREAAEAVVGDTGEMLAMLEQKGIITALATPAMPVNGPHSRAPLFVFSHSLIHKHLLNRETIGARRLTDLIEAGVPLYSLLPFQLLLQCPGAELPMLGADGLLRFESRISPAVAKLAEGPDWKQAMIVWRTLERLFAAAESSLSPPERAAIEREISHDRLSIFVRENYSEDYERCVARFLELTAHPVTEREGRLRLCALDHLLAMEHVIGKANVGYVWEESENVVRAIPEILASRRYVQFLSALASYVLAVRGAALHGRGTLARIEEKLESIMKSPGADEDLRRFAWQKLAPLFLRNFNTPEELENRMRLREELNRRVSVGDWFFLMEDRVLLETVGEIDEMFKSYDQWHHRVVGRGLHRTARSITFTHYRALALAGADRREIERKADALLDNPVPLPEPNRHLFARSFALTALLCGDLPWAARLFDRFPQARALAAPAVTIIMALDGGDDDALRAFVAAAREGPAQDEMIPSAFIPEPSLEMLAAMLLEGSGDEETLRSCVESIAGAPMLRAVEALRASAAIMLVEEIARRQGAPEPAARLAAPVKRLLLGALEWCAARRLPPVIGMLLEHHGGLLTARERTAWNNRLAAAIEERGALFADGSNKPPLALSVIGTIAIVKRDSQPHRLRGERMRVLLALMVANAIAARPLAHEEFAAIATGIENDPDAARLSLTHMVYRLRETIGTHAVITAAAARGDHAARAGQAATPRLDLEVIDVDLIRAWRALDRAADALADGVLVKAARALREAIDVVDGEVVFPTLYDRFFEALRTDIERRLHELVTAVAARLAEEGDREGSRALLERALATMPNDDALTEQLRGIPRPQDDMQNRGPNPWQ